MGYTHNRTHTLSSPSHPDTSRLPHLLLYLLFVSCSLLCLSSGSLQPSPIPPLIFVFLKAIVLLDHYEILRGTDCCPPYPGENRKVARASLAAPVLSRVASHWYYHAPQTVRPVCWRSFQSLIWAPVPGEGRNDIWLLLRGTQSKCIFPEHLSRVRLTPEAVG